MVKEESIKALCKAIEDMMGFQMATPRNFEMLSEKIFSKQHVTLSVSTLKRLWGYAGLEANPRIYTLDTLAQLAGFKNFSAFDASLKQTIGQQSLLFLSNAITTNILETGQRLLLTWHPDRRCIIEHLGNGRFKVVEAENTKLSVGDTFECHLFINHEPLYIDRLVHNGMPPLSYVAGRRDGVSVRKL